MSHIVYGSCMSSDIFFISGHSFNLSKLLKACLFLVEKACFVSSNLIDFNVEEIVSEKKSRC